MAIVNGFGTDVGVSPKRGYLSLRRRKQFAMFTHRVRLGDPSDVDAEVRGWLRDAYEAAG